ncbi:MAG: tyrosine-protein phosphatase [Bacilli bacterium]|nr:tyrosine-protein phosphatase [Bacilli bacterium]
MNKKSLLILALSFGMLVGCANNAPIDSSEPAGESTSHVSESEAPSQTTSQKPGSTSSNAPTTSSAINTSYTPIPGDPFIVTTDLTATKEIHTASQKAYLSYAGQYIDMPSDQYPDGSKSAMTDSDPLGVKIEWIHTALEGKTLKNYAITFGKEADLSDGYRLKGTKTQNLSLYNVYLGKNYFKIDAEYSDGTKEESSILSFNVDGTAPRNIKIDGMTNCRDMGGRTLAGGGKLKQGLIYRTSGVKGNYPANITDAGIEEVKNHLKMKTEINVADSETYNGKNLGWDVINCKMDYDSQKKTYHHFSRNAESAKKVFEYLADETRYPIMYHCRIGTDRTGLVAILINGLLGVSENEMYQDYLFSNFGKIGEKRYIGEAAGQDNIENYVNAIKSMPGSNFANKTYNALLAIGVAKTTLDKVINFLTEGTPVSGNDAGQMIGMGTSLTATGATMSTSTTNAHPAQYYKLDSTSKSVSYTINVGSDMNAAISAYIGCTDGSTSKTLASVLKAEVDGTEITLPTTNLRECGFGTINSRTCYFFNVLGTQALTAGSHTIKLTPKTSTALNIGTIGVFNTASAPAPTPETSSSDPAPTSEPIVFAMSAASGSSGEYVKHGGKSTYPAETPVADSYSTWSLTGVEAGNYTLMMNCTMSSGDHTDRYWYNMAIAGNETRTSSQDTADKDPFRYVFHIDSTKVDITNDKNYGDNGMSTNTPVDVAMASVTIPTGATTLRVTRCNLGFSVKIYSLKLVKA